MIKLDSPIEEIVGHTGEEDDHHPTLPSPVLFDDDPFWRRVDLAKEELNDAD